MGGFGEIVIDVRPLYLEIRPNCQQLYLGDLEYLRSLAILEFIAGSDSYQNLSNVNKGSIGQQSQPHIVALKQLQQLVGRYTSMRHQDNGSGAPS